MNVRTYLRGAGLAIVATATIAGVSSAQSGDTVTATSTVTKGGTPKKPKTVANAFGVDVSGPTGMRANTATEYDLTWTGLRQNGNGFPVCTAEQIDAAQSDAGCPQGSMIATGKLTAVIGPENDKTATGALCKKDLHVYNTGPHTVAILGVGSPADCLGIGYIAPSPGTFKQSGNTLKLTLPIPENVRSPLPGVSGYFSHLDASFKKLSTTYKHKQVSYFSSTGCKGVKTRAFSWKVISAEVPQGVTSSSSAGKC